MPKLHIFIHAGNPRTLCGILDRDGIAYGERQSITCKRCKGRIKKNYRSVNKSIKDKQYIGKQVSSGKKINPKKISGKIVNPKI